MITYPYREAKPGYTVPDEYRDVLLSRIKSEYEQRAIEFLLDTSSTLDVHPAGYRPMPWDKEGVSRNTVVFVMRHAEHIYTSEFGLSIKDTEAGKKYPSAYDILACLSPYVYAGNVDDFAQEFGYELPSEALSAFSACQAEAEALQKMYSEQELERLVDIA